MGFVQPQVCISSAAHGQAVCSLWVSSALQGHCTPLHHILHPHLQSSCHLRPVSFCTAPLPYQKYLGLHRISSCHYCLHRTHGYTTQREANMKEIRHSHQTIRIATVTAKPRKTRAAGRQRQVWPKPAWQAGPEPLQTQYKSCSLLLARTILYCWAKAKTHVRVVSKETNVTH